MAESKLSDLVMWPKIFLYGALFRFTLTACTKAQYLYSRPVPSCAKDTRGNVPLASRIGIRFLPRSPFAFSKMASRRLHKPPPHKQ
jgi:hypothetical protein